jgi:hypothetical protein
LAGAPTREHRVHRLLDQHLDSHPLALERTLETPELRELLARSDVEPCTTATDPLHPRLQRPAELPDDALLLLESGEPFLDRQLFVDANDDTDAR